MIFLRGHKTTYANEGILIYIEKEQSFCSKPFLTSDFTLMLGCAYLGLDVSLSSMEILNVSGLCPQHLWIPKKLALPRVVVAGSVILETSDDWMNGTGIDLFEKAPIYYDRKTNWCCVSNNLDEPPDQNIEFSKGCILSFASGKFIALWLNPTYQ